MQTKTIATLLLVTSVSLSGCSTTPETESSPSAWNAYQQFKKELENNPEKPAFDRHLASDWIELFDSAEGGELNELKNYAAYPVWLSSTRAHYEKASESGYCLSANGTAFDGSPGTVSVQYVREQDQVKASEIHYQYWENESEFPDEAKCPSDFELGFPES